jgi:hypothetical protein
MAPALRNELEASKCDVPAVGIAALIMFAAARGGARALPARRGSGAARSQAPAALGPRPPAPLAARFGGVTAARARRRGGAPEPRRVDLR